MGGLWTHGVRRRYRELCRRRKRLCLSWEPSAFNSEDVDKVGDAVEQGAGEVLAGEDGGSFLEGQVRGRRWWCCSRSAG